MKDSLIDKLIIQFDDALRAITGSMPVVNRPTPTSKENEPPLTKAEKSHVAGLMRVNHTGEVCAQALYQGQALVARSKHLQKELKQAALEENDHLNWCQNRVKQCNSHVSYLNPLWYAGAISIGMIAGSAGDKWNLGFLAETERQVVKHLQSHLEKLPKHDEKTKTILKVMIEDEAKHATTAENHGAANLPQPIKFAMKFSAGIMTRLTYYI